MDSDESSRLRPVKRRRTSFGGSVTTKETSSKGILHHQKSPSDTNVAISLSRPEFNRAGAEEFEQSGSLDAIVDTSDSEERLLLDVSITPRFQARSLSSEATPASQQSIKIIVPKALNASDSEIVTNLPSSPKTSSWPPISSPMMTQTSLDIVKEPVSGVCVPSNEHDEHTGDQKSDHADSDGSKTESEEDWPQVTWRKVVEPLRPSDHSGDQQIVQEAVYERPSSRSNGEQWVLGGSPQRLSPKPTTSQPQSTNAIQRSPSLTPPPPSPPRRRTRESNKNFAPYTAYKKVFGDKELRLLEERESRRRTHKRHLDELEEEDPAWTASQSQIEEESQAFPVFSPQRQRTSSNTKKLPPIPTPAWDSISKRPKKPNHLVKSVSREAPPSPLRRMSKRSPVNRKLLQEKPRRSQNSVDQNDGSSSPRASPSVVAEALRRLYGEDSDDDDELLRSAHIASKSMGIPEDENQEATGPGTSDSAMESVNSAENDTEGSASQMKVEDADESMEEEESEDELDRRRQRILSRVWPTVLIQKKAEEARRKEQERQRRDREEERARRRARGLGDSDPSESGDEEAVTLHPGQSRVKTPRQHRTPAREASVSPPAFDELIDLTSDRESLDNDVEEDLREQRSDTYSSRQVRHNLESEMSNSDMEGVPMMEAMEDNRVAGIIRRVDGSSGTRNQRSDVRRVRQRLSSHERPQMVQTRIDRMLNSVHGISKRKSSNTVKPRKHSGSHSTGSKPRSTYQSRLSLRPPERDSDHHALHVSIPSSGVNKRHPMKRKSDRGPSGVTVVMRGDTQFSADLVDALTAKSHPTRSKPPYAARSTQPRSVAVDAASSSHDDIYVQESSDLPDLDASIEISLHSALAFGMKRTREGFQLPETSWLMQGRLLDLVNILSGRSSASRPLPFHASGIRFDPSIPIPEFQVQIPTICDLLYEAAFDNGPEAQAQLHNLTRYVCLYVSWSVETGNEDCVDVLNHVKGQVVLLMERIEEELNLKQISGKQFTLELFSIHWFAVEVSNRIACAILALEQREAPSTFILSDATADRFAISLMSRLFEFGIRRSCLAFHDAPRADPLSLYTLELWVALIQINLLDPSATEVNKDSSDVFWKQVVRGLDRSTRPFTSVVHETEFIFASIFCLCSISSIDALGLGTDRRRLASYWPIVCRALSLIDLSQTIGKDKKVPQATLVAKDTYTGMLFARCNVLAFRWDWSLADQDEFKQLFDILRGALKGRRFMNLLHEQSEFPRFITYRNLDLLRRFEAKDSIQTILIKLLFKKLQDAGEDIQTSRKWISMLATASVLEYTRDKPPTQKDLSALFNQLTIKIILFFVAPNLPNAQAQIGSCKKTIDFKVADQRSRQICIRTAMIFGRLHRHYGLPIQVPIAWITEMCLNLIEELARGRTTFTSHQLKEISMLCALSIASVRDVLLSNTMDDDQTPLEPIFPQPSCCMLDIIPRLLVISRDDERCLNEIILLFKVIFDLRSHFFPDPSLPDFPRETVVEEESQEDYGFAPIDMNDLNFMEERITDGESLHQQEDRTLAQMLIELIGPVTSIVSRLAYAESAERKNVDVIAWIECWADLSLVVTSHNIKGWDYFLQRSPSTLGRVEDFAWIQETEPIFLMNILRGDPKVYQVSSDKFIKAWFMTMGADSAHILPSYTFTLFRVDGLRHPIFANVPFPRAVTEEDFDEGLFISNRMIIIESVLSNVEQNLQRISSGDSTDERIRLNAEAISGVAELLKAMRHNVTTYISSREGGAVVEYVEFCMHVVTILRSLEIGRQATLTSLLHEHWIDRAEAWLRNE